METIVLIVIIIDVLAVALFVHVAYEAIVYLRIESILEKNRKMINKKSDTKIKQ